MFRHHAINKRRRNILIGLVVFSCLGFILHDGLQTRLMSLVQVIVPLQSAVNYTTDKIIPGKNRENDIAGADHLALKHKVAALTQRIVELENENAMLTSIRSTGFTNQSMGTKGKLVPAKVITEDLLPWHSSKLLKAGTRDRVSKGSVVSSATFSINRGTEDGIVNEMSILISEVVIGIVEQATTYTSRIKLLSDSTVLVQVLIGHFDDGLFTFEPGAFWLRGTGKNYMEIRDVELKDVENEKIMVGDTIVTDPTAGFVPAALTIGTITKIEVDPDNPLLVILRVESPIDLESVKKVYVYAEN